MSKPFIVAEIGASHAGSIYTAKSLLEKIKEYGANAAKIQTWKKDTMCLDRGYIIKGGAWAGKNLFKLYQEAHTPWEWHQELFNYAKELDLTLFSTPFDKESIDFLETLDCPIYKIASFEIVDLELITYAAGTNRPLIISTGMASQKEIHDAVVTALENECLDITLLKCTSAYPATCMNLSTLNDLKGAGCKIGLSDHSIGSSAACVAIAYGATIIEKHVSYGESLDSGFATPIKEFRKFVDDCHAAYNAIGEVTYGAPSEETTELRRSLYFSKSINKGDLITKEHISTARPSLGMRPSDLNKVVGTRASSNFTIGTPVTEGCLRVRQEPHIGLTD